MLTRSVTRCAPDAAAWLPAIEHAARDAGTLILQVYEGDFDVRAKGDASPVTAADELAEALILERLARIAPDVPVVAEEAAAAGRVPAIGRRFWLVDPLDGTREFVNRNGEFTVNIALIEDGAPVLGVVLAPVLGRLFAGVVGEGAWSVATTRASVCCRGVPEEGHTVLASRSHGDVAALEAYLADFKVARTFNAGSSLKLCLIAAGEADLYPRFGRTMEWDTAAGHAVLSAAGGEVVDMTGVPLRYGKAGFENPNFVARAARVAG